MTPHTSGSLAEHLGAELLGPSAIQINGINGLDDAEPGQVTFISTGRYARRWADSRASAAIVSRGVKVPDHDPGIRALIVVPDAEIASIAVLQLFAPPEALPEPGVHETAWVHPEATLGADVRVGPQVTIERGARIGDRVVLHAGVRISPEVVVGDDSMIHGNVVIGERCHLGRRVILYGGVVIGADGFGYRPAPDGSGLLKMPHVGTVDIHDDVEIGANSCVDRGKFGATTIGAGTKIDNLVQIAHNCRIGRGVVIAGMSGLAGSVQIEDDARLGGGVGVAEHIKIGAGAEVTGRSGVMRNVESGHRVGHGLPAEEAGVALRQLAAIRKLPDLISKLSQAAERQE